MGETDVFCGFRNFTLPTLQVIGGHTCGSCDLYLQEADFHGFALLLSITKGISRKVNCD